MKRIIKYELSPLAEGVYVQTIPVQVGCIVRKIAEKDGKLNAWIEIEDEKPRFQFDIIMVGTGRAIPRYEDIAYIDTIIIGSYVWHFYIAYAHNKLR